MSTTKKVNLVIPEVIADIINENLQDKCKFAPLAMIDETLAGNPGDTVTLPKYSYIGDAVDVPEGEAIPISLLIQDSCSATIKKAGRGIEITDEAALCGYGDPIGEAAKQIQTAITQKIDNDLKTCLDSIGVNMTVGDGTDSLTPNLIADTLVKFGEDIDGEKVIIISPKQLADLRKDPNFLPVSDIAADIIIRGTVGMIHGCQIVISNKITELEGKFTNYIVKKGALAVFLKRETLVESDRDIVCKKSIITADKHYIAYLYDESKAIKLITKA